MGKNIFWVPWGYIFLIKMRSSIYCRITRRRGILGEKGYRKDIGTIESYYKESLALTEDIPPLDMFDEQWLIFSRPRFLAPAKINDAHMARSIVAEGAMILSDTTIKHSI